MIVQKITVLEVQAFRQTRPWERNKVEKKHERKSSYYSFPQIDPELNFNVHLLGSPEVQQHGTQRIVRN